jgi:DNA invertase Pin-like site-specific DNA recombinase
MEIHAGLCRLLPRLHRPAGPIGLEAQRSAVAGFVGVRELVAEFTEVESGKRADRPQLAAALELCRRRAMLVIAKLDRLARNVAFIANLMEAGVEFTAVDMPSANKLTLHILAAVAEHEREMISARTRAALAAARARGVKLGRPDRETRHMRTARSAKVAAFRATVLPEVRRLIGQGMSQRQIAAELNRRGLTTYAGRPWRVQHVNSLLAAGSGAPT